MKTTTLPKRLSIFLFVLALMSMFNAKSYAACQANFTWVQSSPNVITFTDVSTGVGPVCFYSWNFGDGQSDGSKNPVHTFYAPGTYAVCLLVQDSNMIACNSTFCDTVTVTGTIICNLSVGISQKSTASCATCADGSAYAYVTGGTPNFSYQWSNNTFANPDTGLLPGTYSVCVTDINGCSACSSFTIDTSSCNAKFTWNQNSPNVISFTDSSTGTTGPNTWYDWNFNDGYHDYSKNPVHTFITPGTYSVCLTIEDTSAGCLNTYCDLVTVTGSVLCTLKVSPSVTTYATCGNCADGVVYANASGGAAPYVYSWSNGMTTNTVSGLPPGTYSVCVTDASGCSACSVVAVTTSPLFCSANFQLYPDSNLLHTYDVVNLATGAPPISYSWSWGDGSYDYTAYPTHTYASAGYYTICLTITDTNGCSNSYCDSTYVLKKNGGGFSSRNSGANSMITMNVIAPSSVGIKSIGNSNSLSVFPNPVSSVLTVSLTDNKSRYIQYKIVSLQGSEILNGVFAEKENRLNLKDLKQGIYILEVRDASGLSNYMKIVKE